MGAVQKVQVARVVALLIALFAVVSCGSPNSALTIAGSGDSNSHGRGSNAHGDRNVEGDNETTGMNKTNRVNGNLPNDSANNGGDSNADDSENDTHDTNHDEGINETIFGSSTNKGTSGTSALVFSSGIFTCFLASRLGPSLIT